MHRIRRPYLLVGLLGFVVLVIPSAIGVAFGGGDPGLMYLTFLGALLWLSLGALLLAATLLRRGVFRAGRRFASR